MTKVLAIERAPRFSPNSVEKDKAILAAVSSLLDGYGYDVRTIGEAELKDDDMADIFLSMGRLPETMAVLKVREDEGAAVINSAYGVERCARASLDKTMKANGIPVPKPVSKYGYWIKRGDAAAQSKEDVVYVRNEKERDLAVDVMRRRGITSIVVSANVKGDLVKFYGVKGTGFFRFFYPTDDGQSKFGDERLNDAAMYYDFDIAAMHDDAERLAEKVDIDVYGGDCIVRSDGSYCFIDFNDWPSFSRCREEAAEAIALLVKNLKNTE